MYFDAGYDHDIVKLHDTSVNCHKQGLQALLTNILVLKRVSSTLCDTIFIFLNSYQCNDILRSKRDDQSWLENEGDIAIYFSSYFCEPFKASNCRSFDEVLQN